CRRVSTEGTGRGSWSGSDYDVALKTGTAQNYFYEDEVEQRTNNLTLVGYAPYDEPEIAFAIVVPKTGIGTNQSGVHHNIGNRLINTYFEMKEERERAGIDEAIIDEMDEPGDEDYGTAYLSKVMILRTIHN